MNSLLTWQPVTLVLTWDLIFREKHGAHYPLNLFHGDVVSNRTLQKITELNIQKLFSKAMCQLKLHFVFFWRQIIHQTVPFYLTYACIIKAHFIKVLRSPILFIIIHSHDLRCVYLICLPPRGTLGNLFREPCVKEANKLKRIFLQCSAAEQ